MEISIEDEGAGSPFSGTLSLEQMESQGKVRLVIKDASI